MSIDGPGADKLTVRGRDCDNCGSVFKILPGTTTTLQEISIARAEVGIQNFGTLSLDHTSVRDNKFVGVFSSGALTVSRSLVRDNGGAISSPNGSVDVRRSTFIGGSCGPDGAVIYVANMVISQSTIRGVSSGPNGCLVIQALGNVRVQRTTIHHNDALGIENFGSSTVAQSTLAHNLGGEIANFGPLTVARSTVVADSQSFGIITSPGGPFIPEGNTTLKNTIVNNGGPDCSGRPVDSLGHNLADDGSCGLPAQGDQPNTEPNLRPLDDYGGPTETYALRPTSPAVDAGFAGSNPTDQRGLPRKVDYPGVPMAVGGDNSDIGAFELQAP
jgi:hypothetical protein